MYVEVVIVIVIVTLAVDFYLWMVLVSCVGWWVIRVLEFGVVLFMTLFSSPGACVSLRWSAVGEVGSRMIAVDPFVGSASCVLVCGDVDGGLRGCLLKRRGLRPSCRSHLSPEFSLSNFAFPALCLSSSVLLSTIKFVSYFLSLSACGMRFCPGVHPRDFCGSNTLHRSEGLSAGPLCTKHVQEPSFLWF